METKEKTAVKSTRARVSTISKFDKLAEDFNLTQADLYDIAVDAAEIKLLKEKVPGRVDEIDALETTLTQIRKFYYSSIEMAALAKSTAEKELRVEIDIKTRTIADLQQQQDEMKARLEELEQENKVLLDEKAKLENEAKTLNAVIADKEALLTAMKKSAATVDVAATVEELKKVIATMRIEPEPAEPENKK